MGKNSGYKYLMADDIVEKEFLFNLKDKKFKFKCSFEEIIENSNK